MEIAVRGGPPRRRTASLSKRDVSALFRLMAEVAKGADPGETLAFSGLALAELFDSYATHLLELMDKWPDLSRALRSDDAIHRARAFRQLMLNDASQGQLLGANGGSLPIIGLPEVRHAIRVILGKGMEL